MQLTDQLLTQSLNNLGIASLSEMQRDFVATAGRGGDVLLLSPTGTGKTLAFVLAALNHIDPDGNKTTVVVVQPSRELAQQSDDLVRRLKCGVRSMAVTGGKAAAAERKSLEGVRPHIVFGTPGRLLDHFASGAVATADVRLFIIDEYDKCLEQGFLEEMTAVRAALPRRPLTTWLISATSEPAELAQFVDENRLCRLDFNLQAADARVQRFVVTSPTR
ncbi:MAG: DEAD/DEAH box helicase, partial [Bacteroidales bacterium]|nr:DEAD/DEAH box helicase [Bacteroidales bacterium]